MITNRVYYYAGRFTKRRLLRQNSINRGCYVTCAVLSGLTMMALGIAELVHDLAEDEPDKASRPVLGEGSDSLLIPVILGLLAASTVGIGAFLVNRLRAFFKHNYFRHSQTIIAAIALQGGGVCAMIFTKIIYLNTGAKDALRVAQ